MRALEITIIMSITLIIFCTAMIIQYIFNEILLTLHKKHMIEEEEKESRTIRIGFGRQRINTWPL